MATSLSLNSRASFPPVDVKSALKRAKDASTITDESGQKVVDPARLFSLATTLTEKFNTNGLLECLNMAIALFLEGLPLLPPDHPNQAPALDGFGTALRKRFGRLGRREDIDDSIECNRQALELCTEDDPDRPVSLGNLGLALVDRFNRWGNIADLEEALNLHEEALIAAPPSHPVRVIFLNHLEEVLKAKYRLDGQLKDLERILLLDREALRLTPPQNNSRRAFISNNLASALHMLFQCTGQESDLQEAISLDRQALKLIPPRHPERDLLMHNLADFILTQYERSGEIEVLDESIVLHEEALRFRQPPHPLHSSSLNSLALALKRRFIITNKVRDLERSISMHKEALTITPMSHPMRSPMQDNYACTLVTRYEQLGDVKDLDRSIFLFTQSLKGYMESYPSRPNALANLSNALLIKFYNTAESRYLDESISHAEAALELCGEGHILQSFALMSLGRCLSAKFQVTGDLPDLDGSEILLRNALELQLVSAPGRPLRLHNLAMSLLLRYYETNKPEHLEEAIALLREAIEMTLAQRQTTTLETSMSGLAIALKTRFRHTREKEDLEEAVFLYREALAHLPSTHPHRADLLDSLADALKLQFDSFHESTLYLTESISLYQEVLSNTSNSHPQYAHRLNSLAMAISAKFNMISMDSQDLDEVITLLREALTVPHTLHYHTLHNLGLLLYDKVTKCPPTDDLLDILEECISLHEDALNLLPASHPTATQISIALAKSIFHLYHLTDDTDALELSIHILRLAATSSVAPAHLRFSAAKTWVELFDGVHPTALSAYQIAFGLLPRLALSPNSDALSGIDDLSRNAAACAVHSGDLKLAVELLEEGRAIYWSQTLRLPSPIDRLAEFEPELAKRFREVSREGSYGFMYRPGSYLGDDGKAKEREIPRLKAVREEWESVLQEIRKIEGFDDFLLPCKFATLQHTTNPVAILLPTPTLTDILLLNDGFVTHIPVDLGQEAIDQLVSWIRIASNSGTKPTEEDLTAMCERTLSLIEFHSLEEHVANVLKSGKVNGDDIFMLVLGMLWDKLVLPIITALQVEKSSTQPTLHLLPVGGLTLLPIHAAGHYLTTPTTLSEYLIPTYTPLLSLLSPVLPPAGEKSVLTITPTAPELRKLKLHIPLSNLTILAPASAASVLEALPGASVVHMACRVHRDADLLQSTLQLDDSLPLAQLLASRAGEGKELAFMCQCEYDDSEKDPKDLAMMMLFAGFGGVVGSMWPTVDGPRVADTFYKHYTSGKRPGVPLSFKEGPRALHMATKRLREEYTPFVRWVPFVYVGN